MKLTRKTEVKYPGFCKQNFEIYLDKQLNPKDQITNDYIYGYILTVIESHATPDGDFRTEVKIVTNDELVYLPEGIKEFYIL